MEGIAIGNQSLVIEQFGCWPSFHDAEITSVHLRRGEPEYWPAISLFINVLGPAKASEAAVEPRSLWQLELEFTGVADNELDGFNHQNAIFDLSFQHSKELTICSIDTSCGMSGSIAARHIAVKSLVLVENR